MTVAIYADRTAPYDPLHRGPLALPCAIPPALSANELRPGEWRRFATRGEDDYYSAITRHGALGVSLPTRSADFEVGYGHPTSSYIAAQLRFNGQLLERTHITNFAGTGIVPPPEVSRRDRWHTDSATIRHSFFKTVGFSTVRYEFEERGQDWYEARLVHFEDGTVAHASDWYRLPVPATGLEVSGIIYDSSTPLGLKLVFEPTSGGHLFVGLLAADLRFTPADGGPVHVTSTFDNVTFPVESFWWMRCMQPQYGTATQVQTPEGVFTLTRTDTGTSLATAEQGLFDLTDGSKAVARSLLRGEGPFEIYSGFPKARVSVEGTTYQTRGGARPVVSGNYLYSSALFENGGSLRIATFGPNVAIDGPGNFGTTSDSLPGVRFVSGRTRVIDKWTSRIVAYPIPRPAFIPEFLIQYVRFFNAVGGEPLDMTLDTAPDVVYQLRLDGSRRDARPESCWFDVVGDAAYGDVLGFLGPYDNPLGSGALETERRKGAPNHQATRGFSEVMARNYEHAPALLLTGGPETSPASVTITVFGQTVTTSNTYHDTVDGHRLPLNTYGSRDFLGNWITFKTTLNVDKRVEGETGFDLLRLDYYVPDENGEIDVSQADYKLSFSGSTIDAGQFASQIAAGSISFLNSGGVPIQVDFSYP